MNTAPLLTAMCACALASCGSLTDERCTAGDACEFRGGPSGVVCGRRWSYDHVSFACSPGWLSAAELGRFGQLRHVRLTNTVLTLDGTSLPSVTELNVGGFAARTLHGDALAATFPNLRRFSVHEVPADFTLSELPALRTATFWLTTAPSVTDLAAVASLEVVHFRHLRCGSCADLLAADLLTRRPDIKVTVNGTWGNGAESAIVE
ncbi:MAG: hypothetical protein KBG48_31420 [Kofleriaceae bacterium]|nr:hypothetical protein [Kofleriaceae bacterium]MBP9171945.1 hypothetical protein [Kofleriaceae bacterium]MBP9859319.1 hypothetical protein [Kofleriaceae bacterium]